MESLIDGLYGNAHRSISIKQWVNFYGTCRAVSCVFRFLLIFFSAAVVDQMIFYSELQPTLKNPFGQRPTNVVVGSANAFQSIPYYSN